MPELPEVETIRRGLSKFILKKRLIKFDKNDFDATLVSLRRFGKALVMDFDNGWSLMVHLRMTGQLIWRGEEN